MDMVQVTLVCTKQAEQRLDRGHLFDLACELCRVHLDCGCLPDMLGDLCWTDAALNLHVGKGQLTPSLSA